MNPAPQVSDQPVGSTTVPCDPVLARGLGDGAEGESFYCGIFTVPQNWDAPDGSNLELSFVVAKATGDDPAPDPLVFLAGGPGQSSLVASIGAYDQVRPTHDIVRLAQRGLPAVTITAVVGAAQHTRPGHADDRRLRRRRCVPPGPFQPDPAAAKPVGSAGR